MRNAAIGSIVLASIGCWGAPALAQPPRFLPPPVHVSPPTEHFARDPRLEPECVWSAAPAALRRDLTAWEPASFTSVPSSVAQAQPAIAAQCQVPPTSDGYAQIWHALEAKALEQASLQRLAERYHVDADQIGRWWTGLPSADRLSFAVTANGSWGQTPKQKTELGQAASQLGLTDLGGLFFLDLYVTARSRLEWIATGGA